MASQHSEVRALRPWYHDFSRLGLQTHFLPRRRDQLRALLNPLRRRFDPHYVEKGERFSIRQFLKPSLPAHTINQRAKEQIIEAYLKQSLGDMAAEAPSCLDLFCADGYYACLLATLCPSARITGVDLDPQEIERARTAARLLKFSNLRFEVRDVWEVVRVAAGEPPAYDLILCTGGLYHLNQPADFLRALRALSRGHLIVQSVVTLESHDPSYFVTPAPGWKHGSRFTHAALGRWLTEAGWITLDATLNELPANPRLCDRGSSYYRCVAG
ncbi:MAG: methyltransferase domain-containing protein [Anaerolineae bacterium]|nr:class I SAM-dependent methyltransferase [Thermoflexales bacterium]MDW8407489.1 methyltransferase domain-containing protein [Anaerolineae bacterium]